ncbi:MAG: DUF2849 domain-containing protein [Emcibacter sp.]|nr:DUF2849 domain-containing protein [Emcibacter sp.]
MSSLLNIISANNLRSGLNVYFIQDNAGSRWDTDISKASVYGENDLAGAFDLAKQDLDNNIVVDCVTVSVDENHTPLTAREKIRGDGPSSKYGHAVNS